MKKNLLLWFLAFILTVSTAIYQRLTGPTYPIKGNIKLNEKIIDYNIARSHSGNLDHEVKINTGPSNIRGNLVYKRYKTNDKWTTIPMTYKNGILSSFLPNQPPAGKLEYYLTLYDKSTERNIPTNNSVVIRFKGDVPLIILVPHIIIMFFSMMISNRTGLEYFNKGKNLSKLIYWTIGTLIIGGFILGPLTQLYAFGELWTGFPFGHDLTDNKTLIALIGWLFALYMFKINKNAKKWALYAASLLLLIYLIPHSVMGSELDYKKMNDRKNRIEQILE